MNEDVRDAAISIMCACQLGVSSQHTRDLAEEMTTKLPAAAILSLWTEIQQTRGLDEKRELFAEYHREQRERKGGHES